MDLVPRLVQWQNPRRNPHHLDAVYLHGEHLPLATVRPALSGLTVAEVVVPTDLYATPIPSVCFQQAVTAVLYPCGVGRRTWHLTPPPPQVVLLTHVERFIATPSESLATVTIRDCLPWLLSHFRESLSTTWLVLHGSYPAISNIVNLDAAAVGYAFTMVYQWQRPKRGRQHTATGPIHHRPVLS